MKCKQHGCRDDCPASKDHIPVGRRCCLSGSQNTRGRYGDGSVCLVTKCGTFTVKVSTAASDTHTAGTETSPTLTVNKANDTATAPTAKTVTYYGSAQESVNAGSTNDGTLYCAVTTENKAPTDENFIPHPFRQKSTREPTMSGIRLKGMRTTMIQRRNVFL